jgi:hypothetical protein
MAEREYRPVALDHDKFLARAMRRKGFAAAYAEGESAYAPVRERLEAIGKHSPSVSTLKKCAGAVGCEVEIRPRACLRQRSGAPTVVEGLLVISRMWAL